MEISRLQTSQTPQSMNELLKSIAFHVGATGKYDKFKRTYSRDRIAFVHDCLPAFAKTIAPYQEEMLGWLDEGKNRIAIRGPHGLGKTALASIIVHHAILTAQTDCKVPTTASAWRQLEKYLWPEIRKAARYLDWTIIGRDPYIRSEMLKLSIVLQGGIVEAFALASDDHTTIEGAHASRLIYVFDEAKEIPRETWNAAEGAFSTEGLEVSDYELGIEPTRLGTETHKKKLTGYDAVEKERDQKRPDGNKPIETISLGSFSMRSSQPEKSVKNPQEKSVNKGSSNGQELPHSVNKAISGGGFFMRQDQIQRTVHDESALPGPDPALPGQDKTMPGPDIALSEQDRALSEQGRALSEQGRVGPGQGGGEDRAGEGHPTPLPPSPNILHGTGYAQPHTLPDKMSEPATIEQSNILHGSGYDGERQYEAVAFAISTPGAPVGQFYDICMGERGFEHWYTRHVTIMEAIEAGRVSAQWVEQCRLMWGEDHPEFLNRCLGEFADQSEDGIIPLSWVNAAIDRWRAWERRGFDGAYAKRCLGVDVARSGVDKTVVAVREGPAIREILTYSKLPVTGTAGYVQAAAGGGRHVHIEMDGGLGAAVYDMLREEGVPNLRPVTVSAKTPWRDRSEQYRFADVRSAMWWNVREMLSPQYGGEMMLPDVGELKRDLVSPKFEMLKGAVIKLEPKKGIIRRLGRSTDFGDAVCLAFWEPNRGGGVVF